MSSPPRLPPAFLPLQVKVAGVIIGEEVGQGNSATGKWLRTHAAAVQMVHDVSSKTGGTFDARNKKGVISGGR